VVLLIESSASYGRRCLHGVAKYVCIQRSWSLLHVTGWLWPSVNTRVLRSWRPDGLIARVEEARLLRTVRELNVPTVDLRGSIRMKGAQLVTTDHERVVEMAVEHFTANGFVHLAYCGLPGIDYSDARQAAFVRLARRPHGTQHVYGSPRRSAGERSAGRWRPADDHRRLVAWLRRLPKPVGVVACNDLRGRLVLEACAAAGLRVPYDVAVTGVDNDDILCELSNPPLTSVSPNAEAIGFRAAQVLEEMMAGRAAQDGPVLMAPVTIHVRASSDTTALAEPNLLRAVEYIRENAHRGINVADVVEHACISRSTLERLFAQGMHCTPYKYILGRRIARVRQLLLETDYSASLIARLSGFRNSAHMVSAFRLRTGQTPGEFRRSALRGAWPGRRGPEGPEPPRLAAENARRTSGAGGQTP